MERYDPVHERWKVIELGKIKNEIFQKVCNLSDWEYGERVHRLHGYRDEISERFNVLDKNGDKSRHIGCQIESTIDKIDGGFQFYKYMKKFNNQIVLDLGAGMDPINNYHVLSNFGIRGYIAVEPFHYESCRDTLESFLNENSGKGRLPPAKVLENDAKSALEGLPYNSASFISTGLDDCIKSRDYLEECSKLIYKKLNPDGVFALHHSAELFGSTMREPDSRERNGLYLEDVGERLCSMDLNGTAFISKTN
ncbi:MAG: hypothetical protein ABEI74_03550 [Candidatus Pacearchaeota archaeon]